MQQENQRNSRHNWEERYQGEARRNKRIIRDLRRYFGFIVLLIGAATAVLMYRLVFKPGFVIEQTHFGNPDAYGIFWGVAALLVTLVIIAPFYLGLVSRLEDWKLRYGLTVLAMVGYVYLITSLFDDVKNVWRVEELRPGFMIGIIGVVAWMCSLKLMYIMVKGDTHVKFFRCLAPRFEYANIEPMVLPPPSRPFDQERNQPRSQRGRSSTA